MIDSNSTSRVLILFAHPALEKSRVNRRLVQSAEEVNGVRVHDLYEAYPDFDIDVRYEQSLLKAHDCVVFQHPLYWYSTPALLKEWQDLVLEHGWAYGCEGKELEGKTFMSAITTGSPQDAYGAEGSNRYSIEELLRPIEQTVTLCGMRWVSPFVTFGTHRLQRDGIARAADDYANRLGELVRGATRSKES